MVRFLLVDLDHNLSNLNIIFNKTNPKTINCFLESTDKFIDVITNAASNLDVIFGESGKLNKTELSKSDIDRIFCKIESVAQIMI